MCLNDTHRLIDDISSSQNYPPLDYEYFLYQVSASQSAQNDWHIDGVVASLSLRYGMFQAVSGDNASSYRTVAELSVCG